MELIDRDNELTGEFRNRSEWVLQAIRQFLDYRTKIIAERQAAFSKEKEDEKQLGNRSVSTSTANDASNRSEARIWQHTRILRESRRP